MWQNAQFPSRFDILHGAGMLDKQGVAGPNDCGCALLGLPIVDVHCWVCLLWMCIAGSAYCGCALLGLPVVDVHCWVCLLWMCIAGSAYCGCALLGLPIVDVHCWVCLLWMCIAGSAYCGCALLGLPIHRILFCWPSGKEFTSRVADLGFIPVFAVVRGDRVRVRVTV